MKLNITLLSNNLMHCEGHTIVHQRVGHTISMPMLLTINIVFEHVWWGLGFDSKENHLYIQWYARVFHLLNQIIRSKQLLGIQMSELMWTTTPTKTYQNIFFKGGDVHHMRYFGVQSRMHLVKSN